jgi:cytochrome P450
MDFNIGIHMDLASVNQYFARHGPTFQLESLFGSNTIVTIAPENLKAIYSTGKDFGIQPIRLPTMEYFCGVGFLTTDGSLWQHSRKLLKPSFSKSNISDLEFLGREVDKLFAKIPDNGSTVDLQPLMFIMVPALSRQRGTFLTFLVPE